MAFAFATLTPVTALASTPDPPTGVSATAGNASAMISWTAPVNNGGTAIASYTVTSNPDGVTATTSGLSTTVSPLTNGTSYTFTVTATNSDTPTPSTSAPSSPSNAVIPVAPATVPGAPTIGTATAGDASASVTWTAPGSDGGSPITGYTVTSSPAGGVAKAGGGATGATVTGLTNGTPYTFTVTASNAVGTGPPSAASNSVTPVAASTAPGAPTGVHAVAGNGSATVNWTAPSSDGGSPITNYRVTSAPGGITADAGTSLSTPVTGLTNGTSYTFTVTATNAIGTGPASSSSNSVTPTGVAPGAPTSVTASAGNASATVSWSAPSSDGGSPITSYTVTSSPGGITASTASLSTTVSGLTNGTAYTFTVTATNAVTTGPASSPSNSVTPNGGVPTVTSILPTGGPPAGGTLVTIVGSNFDPTSTVAFGGTPSSGGVTYVSSSEVKATSPAGTLGAVVDITVTTIGGTSAASSADLFTYATAPTWGPPPQVTALAGHLSAVVSWTAAISNGSTISAYTVTPSPSGPIVSASGTSTSATVTGLSGGVSYTFTVTAINGFGSTPSAPSNAVTVAGAGSSCLTATLTPNPLQSQFLRGTAFNVTASSTGCPSPVYDFFLIYPNRSVIHWYGWSSLATLTFSTNPGSALGTYTVRLGANEAGDSLALFEAKFSLSFTLVSGCVNATISAGSTSPQAAGTSVTFTASFAPPGSLCSAPEYEFWWQYAGGSWNVGQIGLSNTWTMTGSLPGSYKIVVWANQSGTSFATYQTYAEMTMVLTGCYPVTPSSSPAPPQHAGTTIPIQITGQASVCSHPLYQFWRLAPGASSWLSVQPYGPTNTYSWSGTGQVVGTYSFMIWAKDANSGGAAGNINGRWDSYVITKYSLIPSNACTAVPFTTSPSGTAQAGTLITITAAASGCTSPLYQFWILAPGSSSWQIAQPYLPTRTYNWSAAVRPAGTYNFAVWVRDSTSPGIFSGSLGRWDALASAPYVLTSKPCTSVGISTSPVSTATVGTPVTISAISPVGCPSPLYQFWMLKPGSSTWQSVRIYASSATYSWSTAGLVKGTYHFLVWARDTSSTGTSGNSLGRWDAFNSLPFTLS